MSIGLASIFKNICGIDAATLSELIPEIPKVLRLVPTIQTGPATSGECLPDDSFKLYSSFHYDRFFLPGTLPGSALKIILYCVRS
jgi:hypothetical protein